MRSRAASISRKATTNSALDGCLGCRQSSNRNSERAAAYIVQAEPMTEFDAVRLATVFATNPELDLRPAFAPQIARDFHQAADAFLIDRGEWIGTDNIELCVGRKETPGVIPAHSERRLCQIVCAKTEELGITSNLIGHQRRARDFDHRAD